MFGSEGVGLPQAIRHVICELTASFTILTRLDGEVLALMTEGWPVETTVT